MKIFVTVIISIILVAVGYSLAIPATTSVIARDLDVRHLNNARQLNFALNAYLSDSEALGHPVQSIQFSDLLNGNYIDAQMLETFEKSPGTYVIYFPTSENPNAAVIRFFWENGVCEIRRNGEADSYDWKTWAKFQKIRTEQGAAANPYPLRSWGCADLLSAVDHQ